MKMSRMGFSKILTVLMLVVLGIGNISAQPQGNRKGYGPWCCTTECTERIPDLSDEQADKIEALRVGHKKEMLNFRAEVKEKQARLNTLQIADNPDMKEINSLIEEVGKIRTDMSKSQVSHRQDVRKLLTEEQKVFFDQHIMRKGNGMHCKGYGGGRGHGANRPNCPYGNR